MASRFSWKKIFCLVRLYWQTEKVTEVSKSHFLTCKQFNAFLEEMHEKIAHIEYFAYLGDSTYM